MTHSGGMKGTVRLLLTALVLTSLTSVLAAGQHNAGPSDTDSDSDFAEFEDMEEEDEQQAAEKGPPKSDRKTETGAEIEEDVEEDDDEDDVIIGTEEEEYEHLQDVEEFENYDRDTGSSVVGKPGDRLPDLQMAKVPLHLRTSWESFYLELLLVAGLGLYCLTYLAGKTKNSKLANAWLTAHRDLLDAHFAIVGDDGLGKEAVQGVLMKESESVYALWCSGRVCVDGMLVTLKLLKRQDLLHVLLRLFKPATDRVVVEVSMEENKMEKCVLCVAQKKTATRLHKDMNDLSQLTEKKSVDRFDIPHSYLLLSESGEATAAILDKKVCQMLTRYAGVVDYIHVSDQYSGPKTQQEDSQSSKVPETRPVLIFSFLVGMRGRCNEEDMESLRPLMQMILYLVDKVTRLQLTKEARQKAERKRQRVEEQQLKATHSQRQEAAQQRKEEKIRADKERLMNEEDPEKARKLEERESRRDMKRKQAKMKMMKIKSM